MAKVSIITGVYNSMPYLPRYAAALKQQTFQDWEAILVDDGSSDESAAWIANLAKEDDRFKLICKKPEGFPSRSRQCGLDAATGKYVAFLDHDDLWVPAKLELQVELMEKLQDVAILHTDRIVWTDALPPASFPIFTSPAPHHRDEAKDVIYGGLQIIFSSFMSKTSLVRDVGFHPDMRGVDDMYLFYRLSQLGNIYRIPLPLTYYYAHTANLSHTSNLFVRGFYQVYEALKADGMPLVVQHSALAQALRTEAVSLLAINRQKSFELLLRSIRTYFISSTLTRLAFLVVTWPVPQKIQVRLMVFVKKIKFMFPTLKDLFRS